MGGEERTHALVKDIFARLLSDQIHCGAAGDGATMKVLINYLTCLQRCAIAESLRMGLRAGVKGNSCSTPSCEAPPTAGSSETAAPGW